MEGKQPLYFNSQDLAMYKRFAAMFSQRMTFNPMDQRTQADCVACTQWFNTLGKKIEDHIFEPGRSGQMDEAKGQMGKKKVTRKKKPVAAKKDS